MWGLEIKLRRSLLSEFKDQLIAISCSKSSESNEQTESMTVLTKASETQANPRMTKYAPGRKFWTIICTVIIILFNLGITFKKWWLTVSYKMVVAAPLQKIHAQCSHVIMLHNISTHSRDLSRVLPDKSYESRWRHVFIYSKRDNLLIHNYIKSFSVSSHKSHLSNDSLFHYLCIPCSFSDTPTIVFLWSANTFPWVGFALQLEIMLAVGQFIIRTSYFSILSTIQKHLALMCLLPLPT